MGKRSRVFNLQDGSFSSCPGDPGTRGWKGMLLGLIPAAWFGSKSVIAKLSAQAQPAYEPVVVCVSENDVWIVMPKSAWPSATLEAQLGRLTCLGEAEHPALRAEGE